MSDHSFGLYVTIPEEKETVPIGGLQDIEVKVDHHIVDASNIGTGHWVCRDHKGIKSLQIKGKGLFVSRRAESIIHAAVYCKKAFQYQLLVSETILLKGVFYATHFIQRTPCEGFPSYHLTLQSSGEILSTQVN